MPDSEGLAYWIDNFSSGRNSIRVVASSFLDSVEFADRYGSNVTDEKFVTTLYQNVLGWAPDTSGLNYWLGQLDSGAETRYEVLLGFAESAENKSLFTEMTGFGWFIEFIFCREIIHKQQVLRNQKKTTKCRENYLSTISP